FSPITVLFNTSCPQTFLLSIKPAWLNSFLNFIFQSLTALAALSRWEDVYPERGEDFISKNPMNFQQLIKQDEIQPSRYFAVKVESFPNLIESIQKKLWQDSQYRSILRELGKARHHGQEKTLNLVKWDLHWSGMTHFIKDYVSSCQQCSRNKNINNKKFGLLKPLPSPKDLAHLFIKNIFPKHGLPSRIVSDRGPLFVSSFWTNICQQLKISRDFSTAYHPETDGQPERVNQILEQYFWMYVSYHQDDWNTWLPLAEFAYNNSDHSSTKQSPFFTFYGRDPQFDSVHITQDNPSGWLSTKIQSVHQDFKRELEASINWFKRYADKSRASPPVFNPDDMVWLSSKNIKSTRPTKIFSGRWLGPFPILKKVSTHAYHLNENPSTQYSIFSSWNQSRHQQSQIGIKSLLLQSSLKKKRNGKSLKYWIQSSRE
ncbi:hypothetical protein O181_120928, partial [Austropuccinia psidii MF-1]|nr:hypothetical protein [Austropuccinia psidii MF-1]